MQSLVICLAVCLVAATAVQAQRGDIYIGESDGSYAYGGAGSGRGREYDRDRSETKVVSINHEDRVRDREYGRDQTSFGSGRGYENQRGFGDHRGFGRNPVLGNLG